MQRIGLVVLAFVIFQPSRASTPTQEVAGRLAFCARYVSLYRIIREMDPLRIVDEDYINEKERLVRQLLMMMFEPKEIDKLFAKHVTPKRGDGLAAGDLVEIVTMEGPSAMMKRIGEIHQHLKKKADLTPEEEQEEGGNFDPYLYHPILKHFTGQSNHGLFALVDRWKTSASAFNPMDLVGHQRKTLIEIGQAYADFLEGRPCLIPDPPSQAQIIADLFLLKGLESIFDGWTTFKTLLSTKGDLLEGPRRTEQETNKLRTAFLRLCFVFQIRYPSEISAEKEQRFINWIGSHLADRDTHPQGVRYAAAMVLLAIYITDLKRKLIKLDDEFEDDGLSREEFSSIVAQPTSLTPVSKVLFEAVEIYEEEAHVEPTIESPEDPIQGANYHDVVQMLVIALDPQVSPQSKAVAAILLARFTSQFDLLQDLYIAVGRQLDQFIEERAEIEDK